MKKYLYSFISSISFIVSVAIFPQDKPTFNFSDGNQNLRLTLKVDLIANLFSGGSTPSKQGLQKSDQFFSGGIQIYKVTDSNYSEQLRNGKLPKELGFQYSPVFATGKGENFYYVPTGWILITFSESMSHDQAVKIMKDAGLPSFEKMLTVSNTYRAEAGPGFTSLEKSLELKNFPGVLQAIPDFWQPRKHR